MLHKCTILFFIVLFYTLMLFPLICDPTSGHVMNSIYMLILGCVYILEWWMARADTLGHSARQVTEYCTGALLEDDWIYILLMKTVQVIPPVPRLNTQRQAEVTPAWVWLVE